jgi:hypothetical protein
MYDRDIQLLQFCAATLPPDEFLVHCLNKFGLVAWAAKVRSKFVGLYTKCRHFITLVRGQFHKENIFGRSKINQYSVLFT